ncbi:hypothetical protein ACFWVP_32885 [Streptomyces sp. NPDC058637]|uniref:hypothetical protein n=1 Tax=Streptomyces sp. NPDC058637 TaxID=3346569 RepID=UPI0036470383
MTMPENILGPRDLKAPSPSELGGLADEIARIGAERPDVVAITAAMPHPAGPTRFAERFPDRGRRTRTW